MKNFYFLLLVFTALLTGCEKDSEEDFSNSFWTINGKSYTALKTVYSVPDDALMALDNENEYDSENTMTIYFEEKPTSSGSYDIINWQTDGAPFNGEIDMEISVKTASGYTTYYSPGYDFEYKAMLTLSKGKIKVVFKDVEFHDQLNNKVKVSGTIIEQ